ncbi:MAG: O-antigen ligase family protein [Chloroflexi bacterium]|nr:O-antigen ligase family protein [Chloroflexota bacterium]
MNLTLWYLKIYQFIWDNRIYLLKILVTAGAILAAIAAGWLANRSETITSYALAGCCILLAGLFFYRSSRYETGIVMVMLAAGLVNFFTLPTGTQSRIVISLLLSLVLVGLWILQLLSDKQTKLISTPIQKPILAFIGVALLAYFWSIAARDPLLVIWKSFPIVQLAALAIIILLPLVALFTANQIKDVAWLERIAWTIIFLGTVVSLGNVLNLPIYRFYFNGSRGLFAAWSGGMAYAMALFDERLSKLTRAALLGLLALMVYWTLVMETIWLSGWLPLGVTCVVITFFRSRKLFAAFSVIGLIVVAFHFNALFQRIIVANINEGSDERLLLWQQNFDLALKHPLLGVGPAGYAIYYMTYHPQEARSTHNNYFDVLSQTGFIGLGLFLWIFAVFITIAFWLRRQLNGQRNFEEAYANAALGGAIGALAAMMLGDWVLPFAYNQTITGFDNAVFTWIFLGGAAGLYYLVKK